MGIRTEERETDKDNARTECSKASPQNNTHTQYINSGYNMFYRIIMMV